MMNNRRQDDYIFAVTNPSFELFFLLHYENSFREIIEPYADIILSVNDTFICLTSANNNVVIKR